MNKYNDSVVTDVGTTYSWTGEDKYGELFSASVFIPKNSNDPCILTGEYADGSKRIKQSIPLIMLEGIWKLRNMSGIRMKVHVNRNGVVDNANSQS